MTDAQVRELRERAAGGESRASLAAVFGTSRAYATQLALGLRRKAAGGPMGPRPHLSDELVRDLRVRSAAGESRAALAASFGISTKYVSQLTTGWSRPEAGGPMGPRPVGK